MPRRRKNTLATSSIADPMLPIVRLWSLRLLHGLGRVGELFCEGSLIEPTIAISLGMLDASAADDVVLESDFRKWMGQQMASAERAASRCHVPNHIRENAHRVSELVRLTPVERQILEFAVLLHGTNEFAYLTEQLGDISSTAAIRAIALALGIREQSAAECLSPTSTLTRCELVTLSWRGREPLIDKLALLSDGFADRFVAHECNPIELLRDTITPCRAPSLTMADYEQLGEVKSLLLPYLKAATASRRSGVNILLHGPPGTGKSELTRVMAAALKLQAFEVSYTNSTGEPINAGGRLSAYSAAQSFLANSNALLVLEEIEDIFNDANYLTGGRSTGQNRKAWVNRALESNPVPTFWVCNDVGCLDPAFVRRFDLVVHVPVPHRQQRRQILIGAAPMLAQCPDALERMTEASHLSPAMATRASAVAQAIAPDAEAAAFVKTFQAVLAGTFQALDAPALTRAGHSVYSEAYDPRLAQADADLVALGHNLVRTRRARICLYGPPGTGKTAYGRWLAAQLGVPFQMKRASDLQDCYVGNSEKLIAKAFRDAAREGAVLQLDEIDSFLQSRDRARASWEVSIANEMLTQMEAFEGVFIASTNLMDCLDEAAMRRFDLKIRFDFATPSQAWALLTRTCQSLDLPAPAPSLRPSLDRLGHLTPGDFATVQRRSALVPIADAAGVIAALAAEVRHKACSRPSIGFV